MGSAEGEKRRSFQTSINVLRPFSPRPLSYNMSWKYRCGDAYKKESEMYRGICKKTDVVFPYIRCLESITNCKGIFGICILLL